MNHLFRMAKMLPDPVKAFLRSTWRLFANMNIRIYIKNWHLRNRFPLPKDVEEQIRKIWREVPPDIGGTSLVKARIMANLIIDHKLKRTVEIGVFRGGTLFPQAIAQQHIGGTTIGIDPYSYHEAMQFDNKELWDADWLDSFARSHDWESTYQYVLDTIMRNGLEHCCRVMRMTSDQAADLIEPGVSMVHIDGNHDYIKVESDIKNYVPKLKPGGFLVMDDIVASAIAPQYEKLKQGMDVFYEEYDNSYRQAVWGILIKRGI